MALAKAEATQVLLSREPSLGTAPTSGWVQIQPNPGGIQDYNPLFTAVVRDPLSKLASLEKGDNVGLDVTIKIGHDLNKDWVDINAEPIFRSNAKHAGNTSQSLYRPTAVTATGYTVPANGALSNNLLVFARGFATAANNGVKLLAGTSTSTEIKTAGLVVEGSPPANVTLDVCGMQGASGDIGIDGSGNLTSASAAFGLLNLQVGQGIWVGGALGGALVFANAAYRGYAVVRAFTASLITLERRSWTVGSADTGAGKTIQLLYTKYFRNRSIDDADYIEPSLHGELEIQSVGPAGVAQFTYAKGLSLKTWEMDAPLESKITTMATYLGTDVSDPVEAGARVAGASTAYAPQATALLDTSTDLQRVRLANASNETSLIAEVNSWKLTGENNITPRKQQGTFGAAGMIYGKYQWSLTMEAYLLTGDVAKAVRDNRDLQWDCFVRNHQVGMMWNLPAVSIRGGNQSFDANSAVMVSAEVPAHRDPLTNIVASLTVFAYLPIP